MKKLSRKQKKVLRKRESMYYTLRNGKVRPAPHSLISDPIGGPRWKKALLRWAKRMKFPHSLAHDTIGDARVSTVFLGTNHNYGFQGGPVLFETMVFGGKLSMRQMRYRTLKKALAGHRLMVAAVNGGAQ